MSTLQSKVFPTTHALRLDPLTLTEWPSEYNCGAPGANIVRIPARQWLAVAPTQDRGRFQPREQQYLAAEFDKQVGSLAGGSDGTERGHQGGQPPAERSVVLVHAESEVETSAAVCRLESCSAC
jgi:hypothetical protein